MRYVCLVYTDDERPAGDSPGGPGSAQLECAAYLETLRERRHWLGSEEFGSVGDALTIRVRNRNVVVARGPVDGSEGNLSGLHLIEARDLNEAIRVAAGFPAARTGAIEVRPLRDQPPRDPA